MRTLSLLAFAPLLLLPAPPRATIVDGVIVRDADTIAAIERTATVKLERARRGAYRLAVSKSRYRLDVTDDGKLLKVYPIGLGLQPEGAKERSGDNKTPEGDYVLIPHHESPGFGACFYICYPNAADARAALDRRRISRGTLQGIEAALRRGARPPADTPLGGLILLHGVKQRSIKGLTTMNWTLGCISMENADVLELLAVYDAKDRPVLHISA